MSATGTPQLRCLTAARGGKPGDWSEDASRAECAGDDGAWSAFLVVADGAGSTAYPGEWAHALVDAAHPDWFEGGLDDGVAAVRHGFDPRLDAQREDDDFLLEDLWHERGSAATLLLAMVTQNREAASCRVLAVGDCVAIVSASDYLESFPIAASSQFSTHTTTVKTRTADIDASSWTVQLPPGSVLAVASDGIGRWLLRQGEQAGPAQMYALLRGFSAEDLPDVEDDVTLLILDVPPPVARRNPLRRVLARIGLT